MKTYDGHQAVQAIYETAKPYNTGGWTDRAFRELINRAADLHHLVYYKRGSRQSFTQVDIEVISYDVIAKIKRR